MKVYLAGYMSGAVLNECVGWRIEIRDVYENWKGQHSEVQHRYPIDFLDPFNGPEIDSLDSKGLKSSVPANAIFAGDMMSVKACDLVVANLDTFGQHRPMIGTFFELGWCTAWQKDFLLIVPKEYKEVAEGHPFLKQAAGVYGSAQELIESKILNYFYKRLNGANYEFKQGRN
jgi:nucleoside 2-deoxyribosyltransferase